MYHRTFGGRGTWVPDRLALLAVRDDTLTCGPGYAALARLSQNFQENLPFAAWS